MAHSSFSQSERHSLAELLQKLGPDAPTLCNGWNTLDLASHVVLRERRLDAAIGTRIGFLSKYTKKVQNQIVTTPWEELVELIKSGPPFPTSLSVIDKAFNTIEFYVHHEDVLRAQQSTPTPRKLSQDSQGALWKKLALLAKIFLRKPPFPYDITAPGFGTLHIGSSKNSHQTSRPPVVIGAPGEVLLFALGRGSHAQVSFEGDQEQTQMLEKAELHF